ncbi:hypothetical protein COB52_04810 [Candidatus Kaiserbacteria bacterium]|nr:MAG: hypothetical protein COB52_04810 [Candidatus Kaiserbacteria bacterium]
MIAVAAISMVGSMMEARAQKQAGKSAQKVANYNAQLTDNQAKVEEDKAKYEAVRVRRKNRLALAQAQVNIGASGLQAVGTPMDVMFDDVQQLELDALAVEWSGEVNSDILKAKAVGQRYEGAVAKSNADAQATGTLISGAASATSTAFGSGFGG